jgi:hypothetical protein
MELLQLWQSIYLETGQLADYVERLPDACECGDADAHLEGRCACCKGHGQAGEHHGVHLNCLEILARLRADLTMLCKDFSLMAEPMAGAALAGKRFELRRTVFLASSDLERLVEAFERAAAAVAGFRRTCAIADMRRVKRHCAELRERCEQVNTELRHWQAAVVRDQSGPRAE